MAQVLFFLVTGVLTGVLRLLPKTIEQRVVKLTLPAVIVLISSMGAKIGFDPSLMRNLLVFGFQALILAAASVAGSILVVWCLERLAVGKLAVQDTELGQDAMVNIETAGQHVSLTLTAVILGSLLVGIGAGYWLIPEGAGNILAGITGWALNLTVWTVGLDLGRNRDTFRKVWSLGWKVLLAPLGVAIGSILGSYLAGAALSLPFNESAAVGAGFGWYSLSGVLLSQIYSVKLGTIAFLSNVFRELIAVVTTPSLAKKVGPLAAVAPGGATAMDTTLPLIAAAAGPHTAFIGFISGLCLSGMVPFLVPIFVKM